MLEERARFKNDRITKALFFIMKEVKERYSPTKAEIAGLLIKDVKKKYKISKEEITRQMGVERKVAIPITVFSWRLGVLEGLVKYMKENLGMNYNEISDKLNRDPRTIWTAYNKALEKQKEPLEIKKTEILLPVEIFKDRNLTVLESIILHLREKGFRYSEIAKLISRDERNVWTIYSRVLKKVDN